MTHVLEVLRALNVALLATVLLRFAIRIADTLSPGRRILMLGFALYLVAGITGSTIKYLTRAPVDISIIITTAATVVIHVGLTVSRGVPDLAPPRRLR